VKTFAKTGKNLHYSFPPSWPHFGGASFFTLLKSIQEAEQEPKNSVEKCHFCGRKTSSNRGCNRVVFFCFLLFFSKNRKKPQTLENTGFTAFSFGGDKRDRTADLLNAIQRVNE